MVNDIHFSLDNNTKRLEDFRQETDKHWQQTGEKTALELFHAMATRVPAYQDFLQKHKLDHKKITSIADFTQVPVIDKTNYIDQYPLHSLCWDGSLSDSYMLSASSGSTGQAYFWPRSSQQMQQGAATAEAIYRDIFGIQDIPTLYIVCFAMGTWIAGTFMMTATQLVAEAGYPVTVVTPGLQKDEILRLVTMGQSEFQRIILVGYPPFVKDVIDYGTEKGINWKKTPIQLLLTGEGITEGWRDHLQKTIGAQHLYTDVINILGSADVGLIAHETPVTIALRRQCMKNPELLTQFFQSDRLPAMYQFDPSLRYFEVVSNELVVTAPSGIPLCRYNTKDIGGIIWNKQVQPVLEKISDLPKNLWTLPMVYLYGRGKFSATLYGITIYPEYIKALMDNPAFEKVCTGKFILKTEETSQHNQILHVHIELKDQLEITEETQKHLAQVFIEELPRLSSEYRHLLQMMNKKVHPHIDLHIYGDPDYFPRGIIKKTA